MNKKLTTLSMPAKPQPTTNIGLMFAPLIMEIIGKKTGSNKMITLNTLHSYISSKEYVDIYLNDINNIDVEYDKYYEDSENSEELLTILKKLIFSGNIVEKEVELFSCKCGKVEFMKNGLCYDQGKLYSKKNGELICNECQSTIKLNKEFALIINYNKLNEKVSVFPKFLSKEMNYFVDLFDGQDILISKKRDTGNSIALNEKKYNIDIEFIWSQLYGINENDKIMIASNHQVYVMFMMNMLNRLYNKNDILFILTPYMDNKTKFENFEKRFNELSPVSKKLFLFYSLNWKKKTCSWDLGVYKKIKKLSDKEAKELYNYVCQKITYNTFDDLQEKIADFLTKEVNLDRNLSKIKELIF